MTKLSFKENIEPQSRPRFTFSVRNNQVQKPPSITFTSLATAYPKQNAVKHSLSIQPFSLVVEEPEKQLEAQPELKKEDFLKLKELGKGKFGTVWLSMYFSGYL